MTQERINQLEKENRSLKRALEELSILNEIATAINSTSSLDMIINLVVEKCVRHIKVEQAAVMLLDEQQGDNPFQTMVRRTDTTRDILPFRFDAHLTGWMLKNQKPLLVNDFSNDDRFGEIEIENFSIRSLLSVPLLAKGRMIGTLSVFNKKGGENFDAHDQRLLTIIATQSAQVIETARLLEEEQALLRMREEMRMAHDIQILLLPDSPPQLTGFDVAGKSIPAKEVGGDYFDFIPIDEHRLGFCLGDVTGKGLPAALLMANLQATIRSQTLTTQRAGTCLSNSNTLLHQNTGLHKFVTMFYGILDARESKLHYCNAGHDNPFLFSQSGEPQRLNVGGIVLGFLR